MPAEESQQFHSLNPPSPAGVFILRAIIIAGGRLAEPEFARALIDHADLLIAADGGAEYFRELDLLPHVLVGDLDSVTPLTLAALESAGIEIQRYDIRKDYTDLELALRLARDRGCSQAWVLGATGSRWDQTIASFLLLADPRLQALDVRLLEGRQELRLLRSGASLVFQGMPGDTVSLIPLSAVAAGIVTTGLEYPLMDEDLPLGATRGSSNALLSEQASVSLRQGLLLCTILHGDPDSLDPLA
jgi:thiamine pyrophosphokinase